MKWTFMARSVIGKTELSSSALPVALRQHLVPMEQGVGHILCTPSKPLNGFWANKRATGGIEVLPYKMCMA